MHQDPKEVLQVSRSARVNCAVHVSRDFPFHALMGFFLALWTLILLVILLTVCHTVLVMLVWRIWYGKTCCW